MPEMKFFPDSPSKTINNKKDKNDLVSENNQKEKENPQNPFFDLAEDDVFSAPTDDI